MSTFDSLDWERYAECYDSLLHLTPYTNMLYEVATAVHSLPTGRILDASCGTGNFEYILSKSGNTTGRPIIGIDTARPMLERATAKCATLPQCSFITADLNETLPFSGNMFGQVVSLNTLYAVHDPEKTLREFHRVLEPGAHLIMVTPRWDYENGLILKEHCGSSLPDAYWADVHESAEREAKLIREAIDDEDVINDMLLIARYNRAIAHNQSFHFFTTETLTDLLTRVGFSITHLSNTYACQDFFTIAKKGV